MTTPEDGRPPNGENQAADSQTVEQCLTFLSRNDDTSRFAGLAMLSSFLNHIQDVNVLVRCLNSLNPRFLDRLLKAGGVNKAPEEAKNLVELAVNVVHAFATLLPDAADNESLVGRAPLLVGILPQCSTTTQATILQTLLVFATGPKGSRAIIGIPDLSPLIESSVCHETALQVLQHASFTLMSDLVILKRWLESFLPSICEDMEVMGSALRLKLLSFLSDLVARLPSEVLPSDTAWVKSTYAAIRAIITSGHDSRTRSDCTKIAAGLLYKYPPTLLFGSKTLAKSPSSSLSPSRKPFVYLFMQLVLIDLRATFPSLLEQLATASYGNIAHRLASDFDVLAGFLGFLLMVGEDDFEDIPLDPELLLKLKADIGETFGLTLEFLRDRWDAAHAGAAGFEPGFERDVPLALTWDTKLEGGMIKDPLVIAAIRALSLWLKEDGSLRGESGGLTDLFLGLWKMGQDDGVDYRYCVVSALEGTVEGENGREQFFKYGGLDLVWHDLKVMYLNKNSSDDDCRLALDEARLLTRVITLEGNAGAGWVKDVVTTVDARGDGGIRLEIDAAMVRLASACVMNFQRAERRLLVTEVEKVKRVCQRLFVSANMAKGNDEALELLSEAIEDLRAT